MTKNKASIILSTKAGESDFDTGYRSDRESRLRTYRAYNNMYTPFITQLYTQYDCVRTKSQERSNRRQQADRLYNKTLENKKKCLIPRPRQDLKA